MVDPAAEAVPVFECGPRSEAEIDQVVRPIFADAHPVAAREF